MIDLSIKRLAISKSENVERYDFHQKLVGRGMLTVSENGSMIKVHYADDNIDVYGVGEHHPLMALEAFRLNLERLCNGIVAINGCRIDAQYRMVGDYKGFLCHSSRPARKIDMFSPTRQIRKLCTVADHKNAYEKWLLISGR